MPAGLKLPNPSIAFPKVIPVFGKQAQFPKINPGTLASPPGEEGPGWQGEDGIDPGKMGY